MENENSNDAMERLEQACDENGIASTRFKDGELVMISLDMMKELIQTIEEQGKDRVIIFINTPLEN